MTTDQAIQRAATALSGERNPQRRAQLKKELRALLTMLDDEDGATGRLDRRDPWDGRSTGLQGAELEEMNKQMGIASAKPQFERRSASEGGGLVMRTIRPSDARRGLR